MGGRGYGGGGGGRVYTYRYTVTTRMTYIKIYFDHKGLTLPSDVSWHYRQSFCCFLLLLSALTYVTSCNDIMLGWCTSQTNKNNTQPPPTQQQQQHQQNQSPKQKQKQQNSPSAWIFSETCCWRRDTIKTFSRIKLGIEKLDLSPFSHLHPVPLLDHVEYRKNANRHPSNSMQCQWGVFSNRILNSKFIILISCTSEFWFPSFLRLNIKLQNYSIHTYKTRKSLSLQNCRCYKKIKKIKGIYG